MKQMTNFLMLCFFGLPPVMACALAYGFVKTGAGTEIDERGLRDPEPARPAGLRLAVDNTPAWNVEAAE